MPAAVLMTAPATTAILPTQRPQSVPASEGAPPQHCLHITPADGTTQHAAHRRAAGVSRIMQALQAL